MWRLKFLYLTLLLSEIAFVIPFRIRIVLPIITNSRLFRRKTMNPSSIRGFGHPTQTAANINLVKQQLRETSTVAADNSHIATSPISTEDDTSVFNQTLTFPCVFPLKVIGSNDTSMIDEVLCKVAEITNTDKDLISYAVKDSNPRPGQLTAKYVSVTIQGTYTNAQQIYAVYDYCKQDKRIKFVL